MDKRTKYRGRERERERQKERKRETERKTKRKIEREGERCTIYMLRLSVHVCVCVCFRADVDDICLDIYIYNPQPYSAETILKIDCAPQPPWIGSGTLWMI